MRSDSRLVFRRRIPAPARSIRVLAATVLALAVLAPATAFAATAATTAPRSAVADKIMCLCGCNSVLSSCPHEDCGWGIPAKNYIDQQLGTGESPEALISYYVAEYGEEVLAAPSKSGFNMVAWVTPFVALVVGGVVVYYLTTAWAARRPETALAVDSDSESSEPDAALAHRLEDELRDFD